MACKYVCVVCVVCVFAVLYVLCVLCVCVRVYVMCVCEYARTHGRDEGADGRICVGGNVATSDRFPEPLGLDRR